jgi:hypothetical protein
VTDRTMLAPYFDLTRSLWVPCAVAWNPASGTLTRLEGHEGCRDYAGAR